MVEGKGPSIAIFPVFATKILNLFGKHTLPPPNLYPRPIPPLYSRHSVRVSWYCLWALSHTASLSLSCHAMPLTWFCQDCWWSPCYRFRAHCLVLVLGLGTQQSQTLETMIGFWNKPGGSAMPSASPGLLFLLHGE